MTLPSGQIEQLDPAMYAQLWTDCRGMQASGAGPFNLPNQGTALQTASPFNPLSFFSTTLLAGAPGPKGIVFPNAAMLSLLPTPVVLAPASGSNAFSLCLHLKFSGNPLGSPTLVAYGANADMSYELLLDAGVFTFRIYEHLNMAIYISRQVTSTNFGVLGNGHDLHITAVYLGGGLAPAFGTPLRIYYDGIRVDDTTANVGAFTHMGNTSDRFAIGCRWSMGVQFFVGTLYDFRLYPFELNQGQAAYLATRARQERWV